MAIVALEPNDDTLHGFFDPSHPPAVTIDPGDTVRLRTLAHQWGLEPFPRDRPPTDERGVQARRTATTRHGEASSHALCGSVFVRGAQPGMHLAVSVDTLRPGAYGITYAYDTAIECPMERCELTFALHDDLPPGQIYAELARRAKRLSAKRKAEAHFAAFVDLDASTAVLLVARRACTAGRIIAP
jgi:hypothetical protein